MASIPVVDELASEQRYVTMLYGRLDEIRAETAALLRRAWRGDGAGGGHQARSERDSAAALHSDRLAQVNAVEGGLCFGRLDRADGDRLYIGRLGIFDEDADYEPLLIDWRAAAARPFYCATAASPDGVVRRRHLHTTGRHVVGFDDDVLDVGALSADERAELVGEAALMASLEAKRTGRMRDIVATIQAEQDGVIRAGRDGVLVVQGGPGTGKTAVALHRAGYLLYTHREQLSRRGVLIVGPNPAFLRYIGQVLPSLGETDALLATVGELYPGVRATASEPGHVAARKGEHAMAAVLKAAVADRQRLPEHDVELTVEGVPVRIDRPLVERAQAVARASRQRHNVAKPLFDKAVLDELAQQAVAALRGIVPAEYDEEIAYADGEERADLFDTQADIDDVRAELRGDERLRAAIDFLWPTLTPQELLTELYSAPERLAAAGAPPELLRVPGSPWTPADVPLLDEAAELLGVDPVEARRRAEAARRAEADEFDYAAGVMDILDLPETATRELLRASDVVDARNLAGRHAEGLRGTTAERAAADRTWTFGHVIVDEAQELSAMAWRVLMRRCPTRSMTIVGDIAQTGALAGSTSWGDVLSRYVGDRWRLAELTVNYRTPAEVMTVAAAVLATVDPALAAPASVREAGVEPWSLRVDGSLADAVADAAAADQGAGRVAVIVPSSLVDEVGTAVVKAVPSAAIGGDDEADTLVLTVEQSKGLEFDGVLLVEPAAILAESVNGGRDLYVALTRTTTRLGVLHTTDLPAALSTLAPRA